MMLNTEQTIFHSKKKKVATGLQDVKKYFTASMF